MFKNHGFVILGAIIIIIVFGIFAGIQFNEGAYFKELAIEQAINDVELTAIDLNSQITNISTEQRVVSQMMANDIFLIMWCQEETTDTEGEHAQILYDYLKAYQEKYNYDIVFFVSDKTYNYYYNDGLNKVVSKEDEFDSWYFNFLDLDLEYDIQIDHDEVNDFAVSLFVNCIVVDSDGKTLGVVGIGNKVDDFETSIDVLAQNLRVSTGIVNKGNAHNSFTGSAGVYMTSEDASKTFNLSEDDVLMDVDTSGCTWTEGFICTAIFYNKNLNWNIIVQKDTDDIVRNMLKQTYGRVTFMLVIILIFSIICIILLSRLNKATKERENIDEITGLANAKLFREVFEEKRKKLIHKKDSCLIILDIDDFKYFNDTYGHLYGNTILRTMANCLVDSIGNDGIVARWGGDEFIGAIFLNVEETKSRMDELQQVVQQLDTKSMLSFSCGIAKINHSKSLDENFKVTDGALYESKDNGKARSTVAKL